MLAGSTLRSAAFTVLTLASLLGMAGGTWDAAWHVTLLRESFWTPPHMLLYGGTGLALLGAGAGILGAWLSGQSPLRSRPGFVVAAIGAAIVVGAAPLDDYWHRTFGADVDVWSFPHLVGLSGGAIVYLGAILALETVARRFALTRPNPPAAERPASPRGRGEDGPLSLRVSLVFFLTALLWIVMFCLNWYTLVLARSRDSLEYPALATLVAVPVLVLSASLLGRWGATLIAACYMIYIAAAHGLLAHVGFAELPFPPILVVPALAIDLVMAAQRFRGRWVAGMVAGLAFVPLFFAAEAASLAWYPHPLLPPPRSTSALGYYISAAEHPWDLTHIAMSLPICLVIGAVAGIVGAWLGRTIHRLAKEASGWAPPA
ncbi:MAG TPA: hypothetical protein VGK54_06840 [Chloroflexota bacterium]